MAAKLQCDICGGKLIGKPGGIFECENCGTEYSTEWARAKIQEIRGTVKVEGTVEVTGKVQIDGPVKEENAGPSAESMIKRGYLSLEDGQFAPARDLFQRVLEFEPENPEAFLGLAMAETNCRSMSGLDAVYMAPYMKTEVEKYLSRQAVRRTGDSGAAGRPF